MVAECNWWRSQILDDRQNMKFTIASIVVLLASVGLCAKDTNEAVFWKWFGANAGRFENFERDQEVLMDELSEALNTYQSGVVFEIGAKQDGVREFVISADGLENLFPAVTTLAKAAPKLRGWTIIAFRPRMDDYAQFTLNYHGRKFDPKEIWFYSRIKDGDFDVIFYHPAYRDEDRDVIISGTYILLDMALGEYDVVTGIHQLDHQLLSADPKADGLRPFSEFRFVFDEYKTQTKG